MGKEPEITTIKYAKAPDRKIAHQLLYEIVERPVSFVPRKVNKPLILYGAGSLGKMARDYFERLGIPFLFVVDANPNLHRRDPFWTGVDVLGIQDVPIELRENTLLAICVVTAPFSQVTAPLKEQGWRDVVPFYDIAEAYRGRHPLSNGWHSGVLSEGDIYGIESVLSRWEDDISRAHHLQFIAWRSLREEWFFNDAPVTINDRYFIQQVLSVLYDHEVFVDIGAHTGSVTKRFLEIVEGNFSRIWAIEPDTDNLAGLYLYLAHLAPDIAERIQLLPVAVGKSAGEGIFFNGLGYASQLSQIGQQKIRVQTIDELKIEPSFIKLHLEGAELDALKGAKETILSHRPVIVATTYHNALGLWALPLWLMQTVPDYHFLMRLHSWCGTGSVIYCIPEDRNNSSNRFLFAFQTGVKNI